MSLLYLITKESSNRILLQQCMFHQQYVCFVAEPECVMQRSCSLYSPSPDCSRICFDRNEVVSLLDTEIS
jgi:hypothetical protein